MRYLRPPRTALPWEMVWLFGFGAVCATINLMLGGSIELAIAMWVLTGIVVVLSSALKR